MYPAQMTNIYLEGSLPKLFAKTAAPIILVMVVNGTFNLVDAYFLGTFVSAKALSAVTMMFPLYIFIVAMATIISAGFSSVLARLLGAGKRDAANRAFTNAHLLSVVICAAVIGGFLWFGRAAVDLVTSGDQNLSWMGFTYIQIIVFSTPLMFVLSIHTDALRCEGKIKLMTIVSLAASLFNIVFNYIFIVWWQWGVAGSAYGTVLAEVLSLAAILIYRYSPQSTFSPAFGSARDLWRSALEILPLGLPISLSYVGLSLMSASVIYNVQVWGGDNYSATIGAYGIAIRILTFCYFPMMGLSIAFQTIAGNNFGAGQMERVNACLRIAVLASLVFCVCAQVAFAAYSNVIGFAFVDDMPMISETARILPLMTMTYFFFGPSMMISGFFQALGDARRAAVLSLPRTFVFLIPLVFILPNFVGETGIWYAGPITDVLMILVTAAVLWQNHKSQNRRLGIFV